MRPLAVRLGLLVAAIPHAALSTPDAADAGFDHGVERSVVKVFATVRRPDTVKPWTKAAQQEISGSGVVIDGQRILTNAHMVLYASRIEIQGQEAGDRISASVSAMAPGMDLAVLTLDTPAFFDTHPALPRAGGLPDLKDSVLVYGYPTGGANLSITKGIVSRIEFTAYGIDAAGLRIQIDAAINHGNSGGPAVAGDKMIGLAFSHLGGAESIGYIIPNEEIDLFLADIADGKYDGKPGIYDETQTLENPALRKWLKLDSSVEGLVVRMPFAGPKPSPLKQWDVLTHIGDAAIDDQGMIRVGPNLKLYYEYMVQRAARGGTVPVKVVRGGKELSLALPVWVGRPRLIKDLRGTYPSYFVWGPMVFSPATLEFAGGRRGGGNPLSTRAGDPPAFAGEELVVVASPLFPHKVSKGYSSAQGAVVKTLNGVPVKNLGHLVELLRDSKAEFLTFDFAGHGLEALVFSRAEVEAATEEILSDNGIRQQGSPDALAVWRAKGSAK